MPRRTEGIKKHAPATNNIESVQKDKQISLPNVYKIKLNQLLCKVVAGNPPLNVPTKQNIRTTKEVPENK